MTQREAVICRTEKKCKRCKTIIPVGAIHWRYGSAYQPCFMCVSCKQKENETLDIERKALNIERDKERKECLIKYNMTQQEYDIYLQRTSDSKVANRWGRLEQAIKQHNNPRSPFYLKKGDRVLEISGELLLLGIPYNAIKVHINEFHAKFKDDVL